MQRGNGSKLQRVFGKDYGPNEVGPEPKIKPPGDDDVPWIMWGLVLANVATFTEMENHWDICRVYEANMVLQYKNKLERLNQESQQ